MSAPPDGLEASMLERWFPRSPSGTAALKQRERFSETDLRDISNVLRRTAKGAWSRIPRIYAVLRLLDRLDVIDLFVAQNISDVYFPFSQDTLPQSLNPSVVHEFLQTQRVVLSSALDLERESGRHRHFARDTDVPFIKVEELGKGAYGFVDRVISTISHKEYARKLIARGRTFQKDQKVLRDFERELGNLKKLSHHRHVVQLIGSYTDPRFVGIIMHPVAECDLKDFLDDCTRAGKTSAQSQRSFIRSFFGCLTSALSYLHDQTIRHKDIKPQNVLVANHGVYLTDFGISLDWSEVGQSTTAGPTPKSARYCAPEVSDYAPRNTSSDMWSLGCVFLEIWTVLKGEAVANLHAYLERTDVMSSCYHLNLSATLAWMETMESKQTLADNPPLNWIRHLLVEKRDERWTARQLLLEIESVNSDHETKFAFSGQCCLAELESAESVISSTGSFEDYDADATLKPSMLTPDLASTSSRREITRKSETPSTPPSPILHGDVAAPDSNHTTSESLTTEPYLDKDAVTDESIDAPPASAMVSSSTEKTEERIIVAVAASPEAHVAIDDAEGNKESGGPARNHLEVTNDVLGRPQSTHPDLGQDTMSDTTHDATSTTEIPADSQHFTVNGSATERSSVSATFLDSINLSKIDLGEYPASGEEETYATSDTSATAGKPDLSLDEDHKALPAPLPHMPSVSALESTPKQELPDSSVSIGSPSLINQDADIDATEQEPRGVAWGVQDISTLAGSAFPTYTALDPDATLSSEANGTIQHSPFFKTHQDSKESASSDAQSTLQSPVPKPTQHEQANTPGTDALTVRRKFSFEEFGSEPFANVKPVAAPVKSAPIAPATDAKASDHTILAPNKGIDPPSQAPSSALVPSKPTPVKRICGKCNELLTGQFVRALEGTFHLECFKCADCDKIVASKFFPIPGKVIGGKFLSIANPPEGHKEEVPLCETDYFRRLDLICHTCGGALRGSYITALDRKYHIEHFKCSSPGCTHLFGAQHSYYEDKGDVFCHKHYALRAQLCAGCNAPIFKQFVEIFRSGKNEHWHPDCYMIHKYWNVRLRVEQADVFQSRRHHTTDGKDLDPKVIESVLTRHESLTYRIWSVLAAFEENCAENLTDILAHVNNGLFLKALSSAAYLILKTEALILTVDACSRLGLVAAESGESDRMVSIRGNLSGKQKTTTREQRLLCKRIVALFAWLAERSTKSAAGAESTQQLMSLVTGIAHYLKLLIRSGLLTTSAVDPYGEEGGFDKFLEAVTKAQEDCDLLHLQLRLHDTNLKEPYVDVCPLCDKSAEEAELGCYWNRGRMVHVSCIKCPNCNGVPKVHKDGTELSRVVCSECLQPMASFVYQNLGANVWLSRPQVFVNLVWIGWARLSEALEPGSDYTKLIVPAPVSVPKAQSLTRSENFHDIQSPLDSRSITATADSRDKSSGKSDETSAEPTMPNGWKAYFSPSAGKNLYMNLQTGLSQWDPPSPSAMASSARPPARIYQQMMLNEPPTTSVADASGVDNIPRGAAAGQARAADGQSHGHSHSESSVPHIVLSPSDAGQQFDPSKAEPEPRNWLAGLQGLPGQETSAKEPRKRQSFFGFMKKKGR